MKHMLLALKVCFTLCFLVSTGGVAANDAHVFKAGNLKVEMLIDEVGKGDSSILRGASDELLKQYIPTGNYPMAITSALVRDEGRLMLIDTGLGKKLLQHLKARKVKPQKVDTILITHMHFDHINGLMHKGKALFPNAKLYIAKPEYDYWMNDKNIEKFPEAMQEMMKGYFKNSQNIAAAYQDRLITFEPGELARGGEELIPGVNSVAAYGHTPGHTAFILHQGEKKLLVSGDTWHAGVIQFARPEVTVVYDVDQAAAAKTRREIFDYVAKNAIPMTGMHQSKPEIGLLTSHPDEKEGFVFKSIKNKK